MYKSGYIHTLILGIVLSISTLLLFIYNERRGGASARILPFNQLKRLGICLEVMAKSNIYIH